MALKQNNKQYAVNTHVFRLQEKNEGTIEGSYVSRVHRITKACCEGRTGDERLSTHPVHTKPLIDPNIPGIPKGIWNEAYIASTQG